MRRTRNFLLDTASLSDNVRADDVLGYPPPRVGRTRQLRNKQSMLLYEKHSLHNPCIDRCISCAMPRFDSCVCSACLKYATVTALISSPCLPEGPLALLFLALSSSRESFPIEAEGGGRAAPPPLIFAIVISLDTFDHECVVEFRLPSLSCVTALTSPTSSSYTQELKSLLSESLL